MLIALIISIINIIINNIINVNCYIYQTDIIDLKCVSFKDTLVVIIRKFLFLNIGFSLNVMIVIFGNLKFKTKKKVHIYSYIIFNLVLTITDIFKIQG